MRSKRMDDEEHEKWKKKNGDRKWSNNNNNHNIPEHGCTVVVAQVIMSSGDQRGNWICRGGNGEEKGGRHIVMDIPIESRPDHE